MKKQDVGIELSLNLAYYIETFFTNTFQNQADKMNYVAQPLDLFYLVTNLTLFAFILKFSENNLLAFWLYFLFF